MEPQEIKKVCKYILFFVTNVFFFIAGVALILLTIYFINKVNRSLTPDALDFVDKREQNYTSQVTPITANYLWPWFAVGVSMPCISLATMFLFFDRFNEKWTQRFLFLIVTIGVLLEIAICIIVLVRSKEFQSRGVEFFQEGIKQYRLRRHNNDTSILMSWVDSIQSSNSCCGLRDKKKDYYFGTGTPHYPPSCCLHPVEAQVINGSILFQCLHYPLLIDSHKNIATTHGYNITIFAYKNPCEKGVKKAVENWIAWTFAGTFIAIIVQLKWVGVDITNRTYVNYQICRLVCCLVGVCRKERKDPPNEN